MAALRPLSDNANICVMLSVGIYGLSFFIQVELCLFINISDFSCIQGIWGIMRIWVLLNLSIFTDPLLTPFWRGRRECYLVTTR